MKIEKININDLISPEYNPRTMTDDEMEGLKKSLDEFGYIDPVIVNKHNNHVVGGNQRLLALKQLGYKEIDVIFINEPDINREKQINVRLNNSSGKWDENKLVDILKDLKVEGLDLDLTGFNEFDFDLEFDEIEVEEIEIPQTVKEETEIETEETEPITPKEEDKKIPSAPPLQDTVTEKKDFKTKPKTVDKPKVEEKTVTPEKTEEPIDTIEEIENIPIEDNIFEEEDDIIYDTYEDEPIIEEEPQHEETKTKTTKYIPEPDHLPIAPVKRIIKEAGAERVSDNAAKLLANVLEENAKQISEKAVMMANVAGRKTINDEDFEIILNS